MKIKNFLCSGLSVLIILTAITSPVALAETVNEIGVIQTEEVLYENQNLLTSDEDIIANAKEVSRDEKNVLALHVDGQEDQVYYEDGTLYALESTEQKKVTQLKSIAKTDADEYVNHYVDDYIISGNLTKIEVAPEDQERFENNQVYPRAVEESITVNKKTEDASIMQIRYTVYYSTIQVNGGTAVAIGDGCGKIVYCTSSSGIRPTSMEFYANVSAGGVYNQYGQYLGWYNPNTPPMTVNNPNVGEDVYYRYTISNMNEFFYVGGSAFLAGTNLTVNATRGISLSIYVDLSNV
jgi:hypothetical protein